MGRVFVAHSEAVEYSDFGGKKFADALTAAKRHVADLTWQELALYNWGTKEPAEVNRALIELIGCGKVDDADPTKSEFAPAAGPGGSPKILLPKLWKTANLAADKLYTVTVARREPPPAVAITGLSRWFIPETATCRLEYTLEGVTTQASKVDFDVYPSRYFDLVKKGQELVEEAFPPNDEVLKAPIFHKRLLEVTTPRPPSDGQAFAGWKGESEAAKGVLKKQGSQPTYISYACAPYTALIRYYKDDGDNTAKIRLAPFLPKWKSPTALVDDSLVVTWEIQGDNDKLAAGQLLVFDKNDTCVFRASLSRQRLRTQKKYDLLNDSAYKWDKAAIKPDAMPYRVQLQAHSAAGEKNGLAIAVMDTEVKPLVYSQAQFVGFNIKPGTRKAPKVGYLGEDDDKADIAKRCDVMKTAIRAAVAKVDPRESVLKIFMAPEFYFRGSRGAYEAEDISGIMAQMREETDRFDYADWLFVFGTAIGYLPHGGAESPAKELTEASYNVDITGSAGDTVSKIKVASALGSYIADSIALGVTWRLSQEALNEAVTMCHYDKADGSLLTLASKQPFKAGPALLTEPAAWILDTRSGTGGVTEIQVKSSICERMRYTIVAAASSPWKVEQSSIEDPVTACVKHSSGDDIFWLTLKTNQAFARGPVRLFEPVTTEILNVALVQKGWPAPDPTGKGIKAAMVYKEYVSPIDFLGSVRSTFHASDGSGRVIDVHGETGRRVVPPVGSRVTNTAEDERPWVRVKLKMAVGASECAVPRFTAQLGLTWLKVMAAVPASMPSVGPMLTR